MDGLKLHQAHFSRGEVSEESAARTDQELYAAALKTCRNFLVGKTGGAFNRPGTRYVADLQNGYLDMTGDVNILIPFRPEDDVNYVLWITETYIVPFQDGAYLSALDHEQYGSGAGKEWNYNEYVSATGVGYPADGGSWRSLVDDNKNNPPEVDQVTAYWEDTKGRYYLGWRNEFLTDDVSLRYNQSVDKMYLSCAENPPMELNRVALDPMTWTLYGYNFKTGPFLDLNIETHKYVWASAASGDVEVYHNLDTLSPDKIGSLLMIIGASDYGIVRITDYDEVGNHALGNVLRTIPSDCIGAANAIQTRGTFIGDGADTTMNVTGATSDTEANYIVIFFNKRIQSGPDDSSFIYEDQQLGSTEYTVTGTTTDILTFDTAPANLQSVTCQEIISAGPRNTWRLGAWAPDIGWPEISAFYGDRLCWARTLGLPETVWTTKPGQYTNFETSTPSVASDAITFTINSRKSSKIQDLLPLSQLLLLTAAQAWRLVTGQDNPLAPDTVFIKPDFGKGARDVAGELMGELAAFVQNKGAVIIGVELDEELGKYQAYELSALSDHLLKGYTISRLAWQEEPFATLWAIRSDGALLGFTYLKEFNVLAWHRHDTGDGDRFLDVAVINENGMDTPYFLVRRAIDGVNVVYLERMAARLDKAEDAEDWFYVDCGISYDGRNSTATHFMTLTGSGWTTDDTLTLTASGSGNTPFLSSHVGDQVRLYILDVDGEVTAEVALDISAYTSSTVVSVVPTSDVAAALQGVATATWTLAVDTITGGGHLEGRTVQVLVDGTEHDDCVVVDGGFTIDRPGGVVTFGIPIEGDLETLEVNMFGQETMRDKKKTIPSVSLLVKNTAGIKVGADAAHMEEAVYRQIADDYQIKSATETCKVNVNSTYKSTGRVLIQQRKPLPATILGVIPRVVTGG